MAPRLNWWAKTQSMTDCKPITIVLAPGSPSPLRGRSRRRMATSRQSLVEGWGFACLWQRSEPGGCPTSRLVRIPGPPKSECIRRNIVYDASCCISWVLGYISARSAVVRSNVKGQAAAIRRAFRRVDFPYRHVVTLNWVVCYPSADVWGRVPARSGGYCPLRHKAK